MDSSIEAVAVSQGPLDRMRELERVLTKLSLRAAVVAPPGGSSG